MTPISGLRPGIASAMRSTCRAGGVREPPTNQSRREPPLSDAPHTARPPARLIDGKAYAETLRADVAIEGGRG